MYNEDKADRAIKFIKLLKHTKAPWRGVPFNLRDWQEKIIRDLFGVVREDGNRQYRTCYVEIPRKNGKSELAAAIALYLLFGDGEGGAEIYSAAADRDQASIVFNVAAEMVRQNDGLARRCKIVEHSKRIVVRSSGSVYHALSAEAATKHGFNASGIIFDELHTQPNRELWDVLTTSGGTRRQPLVFAITTAGFDRNSICWEQHEYAENIKKGIVTDPTFYPVIFSAPESAEWTDEKVWKDCNPALGEFRDLEEMRSLCNKAKETPALQNTFRRLYLCQWTQQETRWMPIESWDATAGEVVSSDLHGETCYAGLDLASTNDIAAFVLVSPDNEGCFDILPFFWIPQDNMRERSQKDRVPYEEWVEAGLIEATPGNIIDLRYIKERIKELGKQFDIREMAYDRWGAAGIVPELEDEGFDMIPFGQGFGSMAAPTSELMRLVLSKRIRHGGNPVMRWMANNMVVKQDPAGNLKPDKSKSMEKIDGMVALVMGLDRAMRNTASVYEERGILTLGE
ncbi:MAG: terminase TerL endonuclease subunit [Dehalococcoidia bacterium]|jgi:phage terminase large subunit-like protein